VIKHSRAVFAGNDLLHLLGGGLEHALLGNIAKKYLTLRVDRELSETT
jgi:hypothetical protein